MAKHLQLGKKIGVITQSKKGTEISSLYKKEGTKGGQYYATEVVPSTNHAAPTSYSELYVWRLSPQKVQDFITNKDNSSLLPSRKQVIYRIHFFDNEILEARIKETFKEVDSSGKTTFTFDNLTSLGETEFECVDFENIKNSLKTTSNELSVS